MISQYELTRYNYFCTLICKTRDPNRLLFLTRNFSCGEALAFMFYDISRMARGHQWTSLTISSPPLSFVETAIFCWWPQKAYKWNPSWKIYNFSSGKVNKRFFRSCLFKLTNNLIVSKCNIILSDPFLTDYVTLGWCYFYSRSNE